MRSRSTGGGKNGQERLRTLPADSLHRHTKRLKPLQERLETLLIVQQSRRCNNGIITLTHIAVLLSGLYFLTFHVLSESLNL